MSLANILEHVSKILRCVVVVFVLIIIFDCLDEMDLQRLPSISSFVPLLPVRHYHQAPLGSLHVFVFGCF